MTGRYEHGPHRFNEAGRRILQGPGGLVVTFADGCKRNYLHGYTVDPATEPQGDVNHVNLYAGSRGGKSGRRDDSLERALVAIKPRLGGAS